MDVVPFVEQRNQVVAQNCVKIVRLELGKFSACRAVGEGGLYLTMAGITSNENLPAYVCAHCVGIQFEICAKLKLQQVSQPPMNPIPQPFAMGPPQMQTGPIFQQQTYPVGQPVYTGEPIPQMVSSQP